MITRPAESFIGQPIRSLQTMLRVLAENSDSYMRVIPDGIYGAQTMAAVSNFQRRHGLPVTGITDQRTWESIVREYRPALVNIARAQPLQILLNPGEILRGGSTAPAVILVQAMLIPMAQVYGSIADPSLSGTLDAQTAQSIASFQRLCGLPASGSLDKLTWKHLALQYPLAVRLHGQRFGGRERTA